jgi:hypothetical protein
MATEIHQILHEDFGKRKISAKFVPYSLTDKQKHHRVTTCEEHPDLTDQPTFFNNHHYWSQQDLSVSVQS